MDEFVQRRSFAERGHDDRVVHSEHWISTAELVHLHRRRVSEWNGDQDEVGRFVRCDFFGDCGDSFRNIFGSAGAEGEKSSEHRREYLWSVARLTGLFLQLELIVTDMEPWMEILRRPHGAVRNGFGNQFGIRATRAFGDAASPRSSY